MLRNVVRTTRIIRRVQCNNNNNNNNNVNNNNWKYLFTSIRRKNTYKNATIGKYNNRNEPGWPHTLVSYLLYMGGDQWRGS